MAMFDAGTFDTSAFGPDVRVMNQVAGQTPKAALDCGVWPVSRGGDDHYYANTILPNGLMVTDPTALALLQAIAAAPPITPPSHVRCFQITNNGAAQLLVPASADGLGKVITNASVQGGAAGADQWVGPAGVTAANGCYLGPGSTVSLSGREAVYVTGASGLTTALEEAV